jgi:uncharacterized protein (TIGR02588 family)
MTRHQPSPNPTSEPLVAGDDPGVTGRNLVGGGTGPIPPSEWAVGVLGLVLVSGTIGYMVFMALTEGQNPPDVLAHVEQIVPSKRGYLVQIKALNHGGKAAAEVTIEGTLKRGDEEVETSDITFDFVPPHSERTAGLVFTHNPQDFELDLRTISHREP